MEMTRPRKPLIALCGALILGFGAYAQDRDRDRDEGGFWDPARMVREYRGAFYDRLQTDLSRAEGSGYVKGDDFDRFSKAHKEVAQFQAKWSRGVFDRSDMDSAIEAVQKVSDLKSLRSEDREALREDLFAMRRFRAHMKGHE
jgi:hypothetical protein